MLCTTSRRDAGILIYIAHTVDTMDTITPLIIAEAIIPHCASFTSHLSIT
jgi:hypothetical protein